MAKLKNPPRPSILDSLRSQSEQFYKTHRLIRSRYYVVEITPSAIMTKMMDDQWYPDKIVQVSGYFDTEQEAREWLDEHEPDQPYNKLAIKSEHLREHLQQQWWPM